MAAGNSRQARSRQAGRQAGRRAGRQAGRQAGRRAASQPMLPLALTFGGRLRGTLTPAAPFTSIMRERRWASAGLSGREKLNSAASRTPEAAAMWSAMWKTSGDSSVLAARCRKVCRAAEDRKAAGQGRWGGLAGRNASGMLLKAGAYRCLLPAARGISAPAPAASQLQRLQQ